MQTNRSRSEAIDPALLPRTQFVLVAAAPVGDSDPCAAPDPRLTGFHVPVQALSAEWWKT